MDEGLRLCGGYGGMLRELDVQVAESSEVRLTISPGGIGGSTVTTSGIYLDKAAARELFNFLGCISTRDHALDRAGPVRHRETLRMTGTRRSLPTLP